MPARMSGEEFRQWRLSKGLKQTELANKLGKSRSLIVKSETLPEISEKLQKLVDEIRVSDGLEMIVKGLTELEIATKKGG